METIDLKSLSSVQELVARAHDAEGPLVLSDAGDECLVVMRPAVFERLMFDASQLAAQQRESLHL